MFALFIMGLMASMASGEPEADAQFFYYPSYQTYSPASYYYPTYRYCPKNPDIPCTYHTYPTYPNYQYTAPSFYYPSYVYPSLPKVQVQKQVETLQEPVVGFNLDKPTKPDYTPPPTPTNAPHIIHYKPQEEPLKAAAPVPVVENKKNLKLRPIVPFFGLRSGQVQFLRPDEV